MTQGLLKSFLFTVVGENWNLRGISYSMSYPFMCSLIVVVRSVHPRRPRGCESISSQGRRAPGDQQHWQATELHTLRRVKAHERTLKNTSLRLGRKTKIFCHQSKARTAMTVWNWPNKIMSPWALPPWLEIDSQPLDSEDEKCVVFFLKL